MVQNLMSGKSPTKFSAQNRDHQSGGIDLAMCQLGWEPNESASFVASFLVPDDMPEDSHLDAITIFGEDWMAKMTFGRGEIELHAQGNSRVVTIDAPSRIGASSYFEDALRSELESFFGVINANEDIPSGATYQDACQIQEWMDTFISLSTENGVAAC